MNKIYPDRRRPYTANSVQKIGTNALEKLRRLAYNNPVFFDMMLANLEPTPPALPLSNVLFAQSSHKTVCMRLHGVILPDDPDELFKEYNFTDLEGRAAYLPEPEKPEEGNNLTTEYRAALTKSCAYWRTKLAQPIVEEQA
jgi:hypothetical protein